MVSELCDLVDSTLKIIDSNIENLNGLRAECDVTECLTQADIRKLEEKLLRQFSQIVVWKNQLQKDHPDEKVNTVSWLQRWIQITELSSSSRKIIEDEYPGEFDVFFNTSEDSFVEILQESAEAHRFARALKCLKLCINEIENGTLSGRIGQLHWDTIDDLQSELTNGQSSVTAPISDKIVTVNGGDENGFIHVSNSNDQTKTNSNNATISGTTPTATTPGMTMEMAQSSSSYVPTEFDDQMTASYTASDVDSLTPNKRSSSNTLDLLDGGSASFVSSPISPMSRPPLSAGYKSNLSDISSSPSIIPHSFYNHSITSNSSATFNFDVDSIERSKKGTPPATPPSKKSFGILSTPKTERKKPATPPPTRRFQAGNIFSNEQFPLTKSKSHEEHLSNRIEPVDQAITDKFSKKYNLGLYAKNEAHNYDDKKNNHHQQDHMSLVNLQHSPKMSLIHRRRLATEPGSIGSTSPIQIPSNSSSPPAFSPIETKYDNLDLKIDSNDIFIDSNVPRSPRSSGMRHSIHHRFTPMIRLLSQYCNVCRTPVYFGYRCRDCKYLCHSNCASKAPNSCGLPNEFIDVFKQTLSEIDVAYSPKLGRSSKAALSSASFSHTLRSNKNQQISLSSSNPSSPSLIQDRHNSFSSLTTLDPSPSFTKDGLQFQFPNASESKAKSPEASSESSSSNSGKMKHLSKNGTIETIHEEEVLQSLNNSLATESISSSESSRTMTVRLDSQNSQDADKLDESGNKKPNSREWDIPYEELIFEEEIGIGRFGKVFKGNWHGPVAIKQLHLGDTMLESDEKAFESFKEEVGIFRKTRHVNLVLFMGACMKPPHLAIVSSFCKGVSLHTHIHVRKDRFTLTRITQICEQICLGMGYLHSRAIVHKDLKPKNIFYENGKVVITDFGLSSVAKLRHPIRKSDRLSLPQGWLCYLAPEIMRALNVENCEIEDLPFTFSTDVYAFGTVFYELVVGDWPFVGQPSEVIIYQVGKGMKPPLFNFQATKEVKDILVLCWAFDPKSRPDFGRDLSDLFFKLPKKRLQRSPSHPAHLQHTSEQNF